MTPTEYDADFLKQQVIEGSLNQDFIKQVDLDAEIERERQSSAEFRKAYDAARDATMLARQLRKLRKRRGLTQAQLAELAGTSQQVISRLEHPSYTSHSISMLRRVVSALGGQLLIQIAES